MYSNLWSLDSRGIASSEKVRRRRNQRRFVFWWFGTGLQGSTMEKVLVGIISWTAIWFYSVNLRVTNGWKSRPSRQLVKKASKQMRREHKATVTLAVVLGNDFSYIILLFNFEIKSKAVTLSF